MNLSLAIFVANHGMDWRYDETAIPYAELDVCRTLLRDRAPDFDVGECGYEGIAAVGERVFVIRCFKAEKWDFVGRDALYMAVTWVPRNAIAQIDFGVLLRARELNEPMRDPPTTFEWSPSGGNGDSVWRDARRAIDNAEIAERARFVRMLPNGQMQRLEEPTVGRAVPARRRATDSRVCPVIDDCGGVGHAALPNGAAGVRALPCGAIIGVAVVVTLALLGLAAYDYFTRKGVANDRGGEVLERAVSNVCGRAGVTNTCGALPQGRTNGCDAARSTTNCVRAVGR